MTERLKTLTDEIRKLTAEERSQLLDALLAGLAAPDPAYDAALAAEAERRVDAYLRDETTARDADEVLAKHLTQ